MSRPISTNLAALDYDDYVVIDKDTGTVLGINLSLVRWRGIPEDVREDITSSDSAAWDYANEHGIPLHIVDDWETERVRSQAEAWEAVANHPLMRRALERPSESSGLRRVLAELDRLHGIEKSQ